MRHLNKIIFIHSAKIEYAEINLGGNVYFQGTQGVGKSTILRAILFFYTAEKTNLGISKEMKKSFDEYYLADDFSKIIFEVVSDSSHHCVVVFRSSGRAAFRFIDAQYSKDFFIGQDGRAFSTWLDTSNFLSKNNFHYTKSIDNYRDYRKIIYGDNTGLKTEFRQYAILQSKKYENIYRTIQNVFLNSKLDANFIKKTIINSLDVDEVINLTTYQEEHLREFESELKDINIWLKEDENGEVKIRKQAELINENYLLYNGFIEKRKEIAAQLACLVSSINKQLPNLKEDLGSAQIKQDEDKKSLDDANKLFGDNKTEITVNIGILEGELTKIKQKQDEYQAQKINFIIDRINNKSSLVQKQDNLKDEQVTLNTKFADIEQKFKILIKQLKTQLKEFENDKKTEELQIDKDFLIFKEELGKQYEKIITSIQDQNKESLADANNLYNRKNIEKVDCEKEQIKIKHKRFFEDELQVCREEEEHLNKINSDAEIDSEKQNNKEENLRIKWESEEKKINDGFIQNDNLIKRQQEEKTIKITAIEQKIKGSRDSFYGWLNENVENWNQTIGKIIDEDCVLFEKNLNPKINVDTNSLYGVDLDLSVINKKVKTLDDYQNDVKKLQGQIEDLRNNHKNNLREKDKNQQNLQKKYKKLLKEVDDKKQENAYIMQQNKPKIQKNIATYGDFERKAQSKKKSALEIVDKQIEELSLQTSQAKKSIDFIEKNIKKEIELKNKEKDELINKKENVNKNLKLKIRDLLESEHREIDDKIQSIKQNKNNELEGSGADIKRLNKIEEELLTIKSELNFIEQNQDKVSDYKKDKRELFDKFPEFTSKLENLNNKLQRIIANHERKHKELDKIYNNSKQKFSELDKKVADFNEDLMAFDKFKKSDIYLENQEIYTKFSGNNNTDNDLKTLIDDCKDNERKIDKKIHQSHEAIRHFSDNFKEDNIFKFQTKFNTDADYLDFSQMIKEFIDEDKITVYKKRINDRFANIISIIGEETKKLTEKGSKVKSIINKINADFMDENFVEAIDDIQMRIVESSNNVMKLLLEIKEFNDEHSSDLGNALFSNDNSKIQAIELLKQLLSAINNHNHKEINLSDSFDLEFKIIENDNDTGWVEKLTNVGSQGTDILVKAIINIMLLNVFKKEASKKLNDFKLHCVMDEIGQLHVNNIQGLLRFANERNIFLVNGSPNPTNTTDYKYTFHVNKDAQKTTRVHPIISIS